MIFCVEDDSSIRDLIIYTLQKTGFEARGFTGSVEFYRAMQDETPELVLLDVMLPGEDGFKILKRMRSTAAYRQVPVIMVTAKGTEFDKVIGLDSGADDYIAKPFGMMELISRIKAVLRRSNKVSARTELTAGRISLNTDKHMVTVDDNDIQLTLKEFELLRRLMENQGVVLNRDRLLETVWGYDFDGETRTVDVHIRTLRQKLGECGDLIETVRGVGYRIG